MTLAKFLAASVLAAPIAAISAQTTAPADSGRKADRAAWVAGTATGGALFLIFARNGHSAIASPPGNAVTGFTSQPAGPTGAATGPVNSPVPSPAGGSTSGTSQGTTSGGSSGDGRSGPSSTPPPSNPPTTPPPNDNGSSGLTFVNAPGNTGGHDAGESTGKGDTDHTPPQGPKDPPPAANEPPPSTGPAFLTPPPQQPTDQPTEQPDDSPPDGGDSIFTPKSEAGTSDSFIESPSGTSTVPEPGALALTATGILGLLPLVRRRR